MLTRIFVFYFDEIPKVWYKYTIQYKYTMIALIIYEFENAFI